MSAMFTEAGCNFFPFSGVHFPRRAILGNPTNDTVASLKGTCSVLCYLWSEKSNPKAVSFRLGIIIQEEAQFAGGFSGVITLNSRQLLWSFLCMLSSWSLLGWSWGYECTYNPNTQEAREGKSRV